MRSEELKAIGALAGDALSGGTQRIEETHRAIAARAFAANGPPARPVQLAHDAIARGVYASVRGLGATLARAGGLVAAQSARADAPPLSASPRGNTLQAALNGAFGDRILERHGALAVPMALRRGGRDIPLFRGTLEDEFPEARPRVVVLLHGLGESERSWNRRGEAHGRGLRASYGTLLEQDLGVTAIRLRYNTGRHISDNGRELAAFLERLVEVWPAGVDELSVVGHSMGGLVFRSAAHHARLDGMGWIDQVRHVVCLGAPHLGAPLERVTNRATWHLAKLPETAPAAKLVNLRSAGVKDLRYGALCEEHWAGLDPDALGEDLVDDVEHLSGSATHFCVSSNLGGTEDHVLGRVFGDILVPMASATGTGPSGRRQPLRFDGARHFPGLSHFDLLNHPAVYAQLRVWLGYPAPKLLAAGPQR